jgi:hypothetical protein
MRLCIRVCKDGNSCRKWIDRLGEATFSDETVNPPETRRASSTRGRWRVGGPTCAALATAAGLLAAIAVDGLSQCSRGDPATALVLTTRPQSRRLSKEKLEQYVQVVAAPMKGRVPMAASGNPLARMRRQPVPRRLSPLPLRYHLRLRCHLRLAYGPRRAPPSFQ